MVLELEDQLLLLDCGLMFPELEHLGVDLILPDFTFLRDNADKVPADAKASPFSSPKVVQARLT